MRRVLIAMAAVALFCVQGSAFGLVPAPEVLQGFRGPVMSPNGCGAETGSSIDPNGAETGSSIDPNGADTGAGLDPDGAETGSSIDPDGAETGPWIDPDG